MQLLLNSTGVINTSVMFDTALRSIFRREENESFTEVSEAPKSLLFTDECVKHAGIRYLPQILF
jgi:N-acetylglutamate synthase/N-acetylornithine aminotransferase